MDQLTSNLPSVKPIPLITIVTPVKNAVRTIEDSVESVLKQKSSLVEYVIVDGCSTDGTNDVIDAYKEKIDIVFSKQDKSLYEALNRAYELASGEWCLVLGADDYLFEDALTRVEKKLVDKKTAYYGNVILSSTGKQSAGEFCKFDTMFYNIPHQAIFYPKSYYKNNRYDLRYPSAADHVYLMKYVNTKDFKIQYLNTQVAYYNNLSGVSSVGQDQAFRRDQKLLIALHYPFLYKLIYCARALLVNILVKLGIFSFLKKFFRKFVEYKV